MSRRIGLFLAALLIAVIGTGAVFSYVSRVEAQAIAGSEPIDVLVAVARIPAGTTAGGAVTGKLVELRSLPRRAVPEGAMSDAKAVGTKTVVSDIFPGEVLLKSKFADQTARTGELIIPKEKIAVSVELNDPQRVAGFVVPGSEVAVFVTIEQSGNATAQAADQTSGAVQANVDDRYTRLLLPRTSVIAVGPSTLRPAGSDDKDEDAEQVPKAVLTLAVDQRDAERLVHATQSGDLYFGLLNGTSKTQAGAGVSNSDLFTEGNPS